MLKLLHLAPAALLAGIALFSGGGLAQEDPSSASLEEKIKLCVTCHGEQGTPIDKQTPVIWGQNEGYFYLQLRDFKSGSRKSDIMGPIASQMERDEMLALAAHFTKLKWPGLGQPDAPPDVAAKAESASASVGCKGCHLDHYQGDGTTARLAGQWREYLQATMMAFRDGSRGNNPGMTNLMQATTPDDIEALAEYLAGLDIDAYLNNNR